MATSNVFRISAVVVAAILAVGLLALVGSKLLGTPGAPDEPTKWAEADKDGFGTSATTDSKVWYTLDDGQLTEVYYPDLGTPSVRDLQFVVSDGETFAERELDSITHEVQLADERALVYRQVNTAKSGAYRLTKTYVTDPARSTLLVDVNFESLTNEPYQLYLLYDPALDNGGDDETATSQDGQLVANDDEVASALATNPEPDLTSSGYLGTSDGWEDLRSDYNMDEDYGSASTGNVIQTARTTLTGLPDNQRLTLALGFGATTSEALEEAQGSLETGFEKVATEYETGWHDYLDSLSPVPASADESSTLRTTYDVSLMTLAAHEDKTYRGAYIASPSMPWAWGQGVEDPSGPYHLVWSRDLYQSATALLAAGDRAGAERALDYLFDWQQKSDGSFPQNSEVDGTEHWTELQLDQVAFPLVLAWQLGRTDEQTYRDHVKPAADFIVDNGPATAQERWENQGGYSPATIAAEIAGLVCAAEIARANDDPASAERYLETADDWQENVEEWTATSNGDLADHPYYLRIAKDGDPDAGSTYPIGDGGPSEMDQRQVTDTSYLELVRLGVKPGDDPYIVQSLDVVDDQLKVDTPNGTFWHRFDYDGYGETRDGGPWEISEEGDVFGTVGRAWPIFAGERGEYELAAGRTAADYLAAMAEASNEGYLLPEQVWDDNPPSGQSGYPAGEGTLSATPLAWTHAQFVRLAWSIQAQRPVEQPSVVACRYVTRCPS